MQMSAKLTRNSKVMIGLLAVLLLWSLHEQSQMKARKAGLAAARAAAPPAAPVGPSGIAPVTEAALASLRVAPWGQDPYFKSQDAPVSAGPLQATHLQRPGRPTGAGLKLNGILFAGANSSAQICDRVAGVGESVYGWKIVDIRPTTVTLVHRGVTIKLQLHEDEP